LLRQRLDYDFPRFSTNIYPRRTTFYTTGTNRTAQGGLLQPKPATRAALESAVLALFGMAGLQGTIFPRLDVYMMPDYTDVSRPPLGVFPGRRPLGRRQAGLSSWTLRAGHGWSSLIKNEGGPPSNPWRAEPSCRMLLDAAAAENVELKWASKMVIGRFGPCRRRWAKRGACPAGNRHFFAGLRDCRRNRPACRRSPHVRSKGLDRADPDGERASFRAKGRTSQEPLVDLRIVDHRHEQLAAWTASPTARSCCGGAMAHPRVFQQFPKGSEELWAGGLPAPPAIIAVVDANGYVPHHRPVSRDVNQDRAAEVGSPRCRSRDLISQCAGVRGRPGRHPASRHDKWGERPACACGQAGV